MKSEATPKICGTWRLQSATAVDAAGRALRPPYGPSPMGRLILSPAGRMMVVICDGRASIPDGEKRSYSSYCGNFRVDGDTLLTHVDAAALAERIGGQQVRKFAFRNGNLVLIPPRRPNGEQRELVWTLDGPA